MSNEVMTWGDAIILAKEFIREREYPFFSGKDLKEFYLSRHRLYHKKSRDGKIVEIKDMYMGNVLIYLVDHGLIRRYTRSTRKRIYEILDQGGG